MAILIDAMQRQDSIHFKRQFSFSGKYLLFLTFVIILRLHSPTIAQNQGQPRVMSGIVSDQRLHLLKDTTIILNHVAVDISWPDMEVKGFILCLPGWNFSREVVCIKSEFCRMARQSGYCLIKPEMGKSIYLFQNFPETRSDWLQFPSLLWVIDTLIPVCQQKLGIMQPGDKNFLFGISTGGRGVAQIAINTGMLFKAGASLSGDYNQLLQKDDKLMIGFLGAYDKFPLRWSGRDNPSLHANLLKVPLYLGHGRNDKVVPVEQSTRFYQLISSQNSKLGHVLHMDESGGHDWDYWKSELQRIFAFFIEKGLKNQAVTH